MDNGALRILWWVIGSGSAGARRVLVFPKGSSPLGSAVLRFVLPLVGVIMAPIISPRDATPATRPTGRR